MKLVADYNNLVIVGLWNRHIFYPEWVGQYLLPETELTAEYPLNIAGSFRVSSDKIRIFVLGNRLHFVPLKADLEVFDLIQETSLKVGTYLPHTPISAFGVNFLFEADNSELTRDFLAVPDLDLLTNAGFTPESTSYSHIIAVNGKKVNFTISIKDSKVKFDLNYHFDVKNLVEFKERISNNSIVSLLNDSENLVKSIYLKTNGN